MKDIEYPLWRGLSYGLREIKPFKIDEPQLVPKPDVETPKLPRTTSFEIEPEPEREP